MSIMCYRVYLRREGKGVRPDGYSALDHLHKEETAEAAREGETKMGDFSPFT